jgi:L-ascorbate metabolism protein UlaG (beta-lactamase superfamily)
MLPVPWNNKFSLTGLEQKLLKIFVMSETKIAIPAVFILFLLLTGTAYAGMLDRPDYPVEPGDSDVCFTQKDLIFINEQARQFLNLAESVFDYNKPDYFSPERKYLLWLTDAVLHYPSPYNDAVKAFFLRRYRKTLEEVRHTDVEKGVVIWNVYNMSYIVKTHEVILAFDLIRLPALLRIKGKEDLYNDLVREMVRECDILFVSHIHSDHADPFVAGEFVHQGKPVVAGEDIFKEAGFYPKIQHIPADGRLRDLTLGGAKTRISVRLYPGHQAISEDEAVDNAFTVVTFSDGTTVSHSGDQSWRADFNWIRHLHEEVELDVLMINTWTLWPDSLCAGMDPKVVLPGHVDEMSHEIPSRIPFSISYSFWENQTGKVIHLLWGEKYFYSKEYEHYKQ